MCLLSPSWGEKTSWKKLPAPSGEIRTGPWPPAPRPQLPFQPLWAVALGFIGVSASRPRAGGLPAPPPTPGSSQDAASPPPASRAAGLRWPRHLGPGPGRPDRAPLPRPGTSSAQSGRAIECAPASSARAAQRRASAVAAREHFLPSAAAGSACRGGRRDGSAPLLAAGRVPSGAARGQRGQARGSSAAPAGTGRPALGRGLPGGRSRAPGPRAGGRSGAASGGRVASPETRCQGGVSGSEASRRRLSTPPASCRAAPRPQRPATARTPACRHGASPLTLAGGPAACLPGACCAGRRAAPRGVTAVGRRLGGPGCAGASVSLLCPGGGPSGREASRGGLGIGAERGKPRLRA